MWQKFLANLFSGVLRNPAELAIIKTVIDADPSMDPVVKTDIDTAIALGQIYANKQAGTLVYKLDAGGAETTIAHIQP